jgi:hypothetical protein
LNCAGRDSLRRTARNEWKGNQTMAFVDSFNGLNGACSFYNVTMGVGPTQYGSYQRDDVMLVQYLLKKVWEQNGQNCNPQLPTPPNSTIAVDGIFGPISASWVLQFQQALVNGGKPIVCDGRVDRGDNGVTPIHQAMYTIFALNVYFNHLDPTTFYNPTEDADCPNDLQNALMQNTVDASGNPTGTALPLATWPSSPASGSGGGGGS